MLKTQIESLIKTNQISGKRKSLIKSYMRLNSRDYTARELSEEMYEDGFIKTPERNQVHPRLNELIKAGQVKIVGKKYDANMDRMVSIYHLIQ